MAAKVEKPGANFVDDVHGKGDDYSSQDAESEFSPAEQKSIIRRIDRRLVTIVGLMYCVSLMDRTNLSAANIAGMAAELRLDIGYRYSVITLVFFTTYVAFQAPSTIIIRKLGPRIHLSAITLFWGACMIGMGFANDWQTLAALRVVLGILEAGFFPGCVYLLSTWYIRYEMGKRYAYFYLLGSFASALAGILAYGLMQMEGLAGMGGWRWIFVMEGIITCVLAFIGYWLICDFPDGKHKSWKFLTQREINFVIARVNKDRGDAHLEPFQLRKFLRPALDLKVWAFAMLFFDLTTVTYAIAYFMPLILRNEMGFSVGAAQCLVAPPFAFAAILMMISGWIGDKFHVRGPLFVFNSILTLIGLAIMGYHPDKAVRYFAVFLTTGGANANIPISMTYQANNIRGQWKRAFCSASLVGMGGVGGIAGALVFRSQDAPKYLPGLWACMACAGLNILIVCALDVKFYIDNQKQARGQKIIEGEEGFRYTY
ncbi:major facilitator superfamily transporter [Lineolata rhizophorae]|uniref:Major facilitator superfamily transporter n=1 Tax=Lineolata rhizophorae TaxID=578093 RepID=A0A6A6NNZ7_9PEZI|nr:major facilitator superfamily transporter [Lineolata rhizophorae]